MRALFRVAGACMLLAAAFGANGQSTMTIDIDGQPMLRKPVKSMLEMRYQNMMRQQLDFSCGAAAVGTLLPLRLRL